MNRSTTIFAFILFFLAFCLPQHQVFAFGAGNIPSFAYVEGKAFRHGDIEDALSDLVKHASSGFALTSLISKGSKFSGLDVKRVYFGNWLRDYSQAVDIAGLKKLQLQSIITLCMVLGFLAHGYVTAEFEVTAERLGVYLPVEHIDNPKGYGEGEDARRYHPKLRGPVNPRELEVDPRSGMKNYIANEQGNWDTSKAHVRRVLQECIRYGRMYRSQNRKEDEYEAFRLLGTALHTLEDFSAHSNFCELALVAMGYTQVFTHVGDNVRIQAPNGKWVAPIVTGTFGSSDFTFSLLGEATDHLSEASVTDLNKAFDNARSRSQGTRGEPGFDSASTLRSLLFSIPGGAGNSMARDMDSIERIRAGPAQGGKRPEDLSPQELHSTLWKVLTFRDNIMRGIEQTIDKIPGLGSLIEKISDTISVFVFTTIEPYVRPLLRMATQGLSAASEEVINKGDQYAVFDDPRASDPTHSFLSKDHFNTILNQPAGEIAKVVVVHAVNLVTKAWDSDSVNVHEVTEDILSCLFHPDFHNSGSKVQREMMQCMHSWVDGMGSKKQSILSRLTKDAVRYHRNVRGGESGGPSTSGGTAASTGLQQQVLSYAQDVPGLGLAASFLSQGDGPRRETQYGATATPTSHYASEATYSSGYGTQSVGAYTSVPSYQPPCSSTQPSYSMPTEPPTHSGYFPSYAPRAPSYPPGSGAAPEVDYSRYPGAEQTKYVGHDHRAEHEIRYGSHQGQYQAQRDDRHSHRDENARNECWNAPSGFPELTPEGQHTPGFPGAEPYGLQSRQPHFPGDEPYGFQSQQPQFPDADPEPYSHQSQQPQFPGAPPPPEGQYGWRGY